MALAPGLYFKVVYNGKNITADLSIYVCDISYTDKVSGESDELDIELEDTDLNWQNGWAPAKGDTIYCEIGTDNGQLVQCGTFTVDDIRLSGPPDKISIKALSSGISSKLRTKKSYAHENKTLREVVNTIASRNGYTILGTIDNIRVGRLTQYRESDVAFLQRVALDFGYAFSIKDKTIVFTQIYELENFPIRLVLDKTDLTSYSFADRAFDTYSGATVKYYSQKENKMVTADLPADDSVDDFPKDNTEVLEVRKPRAENEAQAKVKAKAHLHRKNSKQKTASFDFPGNALALSGNNLQLTGFGLFTGVYHITQASHKLNNSGYTCSVDAKWVNKPLASANKKPLAGKSDNKNYNTK